jgi:hypothetical protein
MRKLVVFSDPGGAKPCLSLAKKWAHQGDAVLVCSDRQYAFYGIFGIPVENCGGADAPHVIGEFQPDELFTGTSYTSCIELEFLKESNARGIPSISFIDHYTSFGSRFEHAGELIFPSAIHVLDDLAAKVAGEAGLPKDRIRVTGNPYHDFLRGWRSDLSKEVLWRDLGILCSEAKVILFAPDPLSNVGGRKKYGTDEVEVLKILVEILAQFDAKFQLLIKAHPNQSIVFIEGGLQNMPNNIQITLVRPEHDDRLNDLIQSSDLVIGMFSNLLVEAEILGVDTLRILVGLSTELIPRQNFKNAAFTHQEIKRRVQKLCKQQNPIETSKNFFGKNNTLKNTFKKTPSLTRNWA